MSKALYIQQKSDSPDKFTIYSPSWFKMNTPVHFLWVVISVVVTVTCVFSFFQPTWFIHPDHIHSFGLYAYCKTGAEGLFYHPDCGYYGGHFRFGSIPSAAWQVACLLFGSGCVFLTVGAMLSVLTIFMSKEYSAKISLVAGYAQTVAGKFPFHVGKI